MTGVVQFACSHCGTLLTRPVAELAALPERRQPAEEYLPTVEVGRWATDPEPLMRGPNGTPHGTLDCVVIHADDLADLYPHPDPRGSSGCCRRDGLDGPNLVCPTCRAEVATVLDDCWTYREVRLEPHRITAVPAD